MVIQYVGFMVYQSYDDIYYNDGEYDEEHYRTNLEYADGVDDAMNDW